MAKKPVFDPNLEPVMDEVCKALNEEFLEVSGTPTATVKYNDGQFKKKPIGGILFAPDYAYISTRNKLIFGFTPEDSQPWASIEVPLEDLDTIFPNFLTRIKEILFSDDDSVADATWTEMFAILIEVHQAKVSAEEKREQARTEEQYSDNPLFGRF